MITMLSGACNVSATAEVTAKSYLSGIEGISYVHSFTLEDIITAEATTTNRSIEMYDAGELYMRYNGNWDKMIQPVRDAFKEIAGVETSKTDKYGDTEYFYFRHHEKMDR